MRATTNTTKPTPVAVPDLADMPSTASVPVCEVANVAPDWKPCDSPAAVVAILTHLATRQQPSLGCAPTTMLLCGDCLLKVVGSAKKAEHRKHAICGVRVDSWREMVTSVVSL